MNLYWEAPGGSYFEVNHHRRRWADGNFDDQEKAKASQIAKELGLSPSEFDLPS